VSTVYTATREEGDALAAVGPPVRRVTVPLGSRTHLGSVRDGEKHPNLRTARRRAQEFESVLRSNPIASMSWSHYLSLLLQPEWYAEAPRGAGSRAEGAARFVNESLGLDGHAGAWDPTWSCSWEHLVRHMLTADWYGWALAEPIPARDGRRVVISKYVAVEHPVLDRWVVDEDGRVVGANLRGTAPDGRYFDGVLRSGAWIHHTRGGSAQSPEGRGLARAIYAHHIDLMDAYNALAAACQRWSAPTPKGSYNAREAQDQIGAQGGESTLGDALDAAEEQLQNYTSDGAAHLLVPDWLDVSAFGEGVEPDKGVPAIQHIESRIAVTFFAHSMMLGLDATGARSVGEVVERAAENQVVNRLQSAAASFHRGIIRPLMHWNYPGLSPQQWPRLRFAGARGSSIRSFANVLAQLAQNGGLNLDDDAVRTFLHREIGLPPPPPATPPAPPADDEADGGA